MQQKLHPGRRIGIGQVLVGQPGHGADEGLGIAAHLEGIFIGFDLSPARPEVAQPEYVELLVQAINEKAFR